MSVARINDTAYLSLHIFCTQLHTLIRATVYSDYNAFG